MREFAVLEKNHSIEELFLADVDSVEFVPGIAALKIIKFCNLVDGNMEPMLTSKTLQQVDFYPMKKSCSHSKDETNQHLTK
ncbi:hypothetical protein EMIT091MI3_210068 [Kosakonia quasisacchari]